MDDQLLLEIKKGNANKIKQLIDSGADVNTTDDEGEPVLI